MEMYPTDIAIDLERAMKEKLTILEQRVLRGRARNYTLEDIARLFGVSRERIRQVEARGMLKLRRHFIRTKWKDYRYWN